MKQKNLSPLRAPRSLSVSSALLGRRVRFSAAAVRRQAVVTTDGAATPDAFPPQAVAASSVSRRAEGPQCRPRSEAAD
jgi:hypothetical protein